MSYDTENKKPLFSGYFVQVYKGMFDHEVVVAKDSVAFLVYIKDLDQVVLIRQPRAPMVTNNNPEGMILEVTAGRFNGEDATLTPAELMLKEAEEEIGVKASLSQVFMLNRGRPVAVSPGASTEKMYLGMITIVSSQIEKTERTFGVDAHEQITREFVPVQDLYNMVFEDMKTWLLVAEFLADIRSEEVGNIFKHGGS